MAETGLLQLDRGAACLAALLAALFLSGSDLKAQPSGSESLLYAKQAAVSRLGQLQRISANFTSVETYRPIMAAVPPSAHPLTGSWGYLVGFRFLDGRAYYEWEYDKSTSERAKLTRGVGDVRRRVMVYTFERAESLTQSFNNEDGIGTIADSKLLPATHCLEYALGLRSYESQEWLAPHSLDKATFLRTTAGLISVDLEGSSGKWRLDHRWLLDPQRSYALVKYQVFKFGDKSPFFEAACSNFQEISGLMLPTDVDEQQRSTFKGEAFVPFEEEMHVLKYDISANENRPETYSVQWPTNSFFKDMRTGILFRPATTRAVSDAEIVAKAISRQTSPAIKRWTGTQLALTTLTALLGIMLALLYIMKIGRPRA